MRWDYVGWDGTIRICWGYVGCDGTMWDAIVIEVYHSDIFAEYVDWCLNFFSLCLMVWRTVRATGHRGRGCGDHRCSRFDRFLC